MPANPALRAGLACLRQPFRAGWLPLRGSLCGAPPPRPGCKGKIPLRTPWPAFQLFPCLAKPIEHTRPRGIHAPGHSFGVIQTMLLALPNVGLERMGRNNPSGCAGQIKLGALRAQKPKSQKAKKPKSQKAKKIIPAAGRKNLFRLLLFFRPNRASPPLKKSGSHARRDAGQGSWYRRYLTIRGRWRNFSARISWNAGQRGL